MEKPMKLYRLQMIAIAAATACLAVSPIAHANNHPAFDPVRTFLIPESSQDRLTYSESNRFHRDLHASMKGEVSVITVTVPANITLPLEQFSQDRSQLDRSAPGLVRWTARIRDTNGHIMACFDTPDENGLWEIFGVIFRIIAPWINDAVTYRYANQYNAILYYNQNDTREPVREVRFIRRNEHDIHSLTCQAAREF
jgi:hypothetical protein